MKSGFRSVPVCELSVSFLLVLGISTTATAQDPGIPPGTRVRIELQGDRSESMDPVRFEGVVTFAGVDSLHLALVPDAGEAQIPYSAIQRVQVSQGPPSRVRTILEESLDRGVYGALLGLLAHELLVPEQGRHRPIVLFSGAFALSGAASGVLRPRQERWREVPLPLP